MGCNPPVVIPPTENPIHSLYPVWACINFAWLALWLSRAMAKFFPLPLRPYQIRALAQALLTASLTAGRLSIGWFKITFEPQSSSGFIPIRFLIQNSCFHPSLSRFAQRAQPVDFHKEHILFERRGASFGNLWNGNDLITLSGVCNYLFQKFEVFDSWKDFAEFWTNLRRQQAFLIG